MTRLRSLAGLCLALFFRTFAIAASPLLPPPGGASLLPNHPETVFKLSGGGDAGSSSLIDVTGLPFAKAVEIHTLKQPTKAWSLQIHQTLTSAVHKGDVVWISVWMRAAQTSNESGLGLSQLTLDEVSNGSRLELLDMDAGRQWQQYAWACTMDHDCAANDLSLSFRAGFRPQVIQLGGFQMLDYGATLKTSNLPHSAITYQGMESDAPWRKEAAERIDRYRKADLKIHVKNAAGQPLPDATVKIEQIRSAYSFGSAVVPYFLTGTGPDSDRYREIIKESYNKVVFENSMKWISWEKDKANGRVAYTDAAMKWLQDQGIAVRGHNLVWPSFRFAPKDVGLLRNDKTALEARIENHIRDEVGAFKGQISEWDVVNEPYGQHTILDLLGQNIMATWFKVAHETDPKPVLFLNDYAGFMNLSENDPHKDAFEATLKNLEYLGAPIGGLGIQSHFGSQLPGPAKMYEELNRWAKLGLQIQCTEFDVDVPDEDVQARFTHDFMTVVFSHPATTAIIAWGFWEGNDWLPRAAMYRKDWSLKPNGRVWNDLTLKEWRTNLTANSDSTGTVATRAFMGDYTITVTYHGKSKSWPLTLAKDGAVLAADMPAN